MRTITLNENGRITLPAPIRHALGLEGESELTVEVDTDQDAIILRPAVVLRREDAWAYTPEHRALLERAHGDSRAGRVHNLSEDDLRSLGT
ncbi:MAG: AbrB/MazE/SpoVT family DNA-binding domain-containing protein [Actinobacteria bacterium]|nr:AbrB/MazE/SpoVT family DNA-binding domain-containing protein [Actinomycetota bacterium]MCL5447360.1 AbrB/MazE/SpoVT family DNA-binding domain-containing protein [Actinomycetota bacterium]